MKKQKNNNTKSRFMLLAFLFGMVVLLSPCVIQNSLQDVLGLEIQNKIHKNKTTFQQNRTCNADINHSSFSKISKEKKGINQCEAILFQTVFSIATVEQLSFQILPYPYSQKTTVPLYILFKRMKYFI